MVISRVVQVDDEHFHLGMHLHHPLEQGDHTPRRQILFDVPPVQVFVILGAYCPEDHEYLDRRYVEEDLTARSVIALFERMMEVHPEVKVFVIYLDNARYHHAVLVKQWVERVRCEKAVEFRLEYLPAYSPDLNLIERLWRFLRKEAMQRWHETFESMESAVSDVLD